jgi:hypothetical protein
VSLIHDALNKTDQYLERFVVSKPVSKPTPREPHEPEIRQLEKEIKKIETPKASPKVLALVFLALLFMIWMSRLIVPSAPENVPPAAIQEAKPAAVSAAVSPEPVVVKSPSRLFTRSVSKARYLLTGITSSDNDLLAVINDQVVGVGDTLREGALVTKITVDRVILDTDGQKTVLTF